MTDDNQDVVIHLSAEEALVLSDWLYRAAVERLLPRVTKDDAEVVALSALSGRLERDLVDPHSDEYEHLVQAARQRLRGNSARRAATP
jgi:hypothetical protein